MLPLAGEKNTYFGLGYRALLRFRSKVNDVYHASYRLRLEIRSRPT